MNFPVIPQCLVADFFEDEEEGVLLLDQDFVIQSPKTLENEALLLKEMIKECVSLDLKLKKDPQAEAINLKIRKDEFVGENAYRIEIYDSGIDISAMDNAGLFYACQTLKQMLVKYGKSLPLMEIEDEPLYAWRGLHIDVSRHFFSIDFLKKIIDLMALLKLNRFHWHLSDDQGWRIESRKFPELNLVGSYRQDADQKYGGYYTQDEIKDFVAYAEQKHIIVVPEIDLPGHTQAMIAALPLLSCRKENIEVWNKWGVSEKVLCLGKDTTYTLIKEILDEIIPLFPGPYFHIGGDECPDTEWQNCPDCQAKKEKLQLNSFRELQSVFNQFLAEILQSHHKKMIGWDEIADTKVPDDAIIMAWRGNASEGMIKALEQDKKVILTPTSYYYFDWKQSIRENEKGAFGVTSLKKVFDYHPQQALEEKDINTIEDDFVLGIQANVWTEFICSEKELEYMLLPRLLAISEQAWTGHNSDYDDFKTRVTHFCENILKPMNINYCDFY